MRLHLPTASDPLVIAIADLHCGSLVGLCPPRPAIRGGGHYEPNQIQQLLWHGWTEFWTTVQARRMDKQKRPRPLIILLLGDLIDGIRGPGIWATDYHAQEQAAIESIMAAQEITGPWQAIYACQGTAWHVGEDASPEERIATAIGAIPDKNGRHARPAIQIKIGDCIIRAAHRGYGSRRPWTRTTQAGTATSAIIINAALRGDQPPNLILFAHNHKISDSGLTYPGTRTITLPCWSGMTDYGINGGILEAPDIGGLIFSPPSVANIEIICPIMLREEAEP